MDPKKPAHFEGKNPLEHVIEARKKGRAASQEIHGTELPGHYSAFSDAAKESAFLLLVFGTLFSELRLSLEKAHLILAIFLIGWLFWKVGRSAILGWARLERLNRLIEEERWEIEHQREQEKEELKALYQAKGFRGKLLDEVIDVLMADDNRLLQIMLEEELGLSLETFEHPLKQAFGAFLGVIFASLAFVLGALFLPKWGIFISAVFVIGICALSVAKLEKNRPLPAMVWNLAMAALAVGAVHFTTQIVMQ